MQVKRRSLLLSSVVVGGAGGRGGRSFALGDVGSWLGSCVNQENHRLRFYAQQVEHGG